MKTSLIILIFMVTFAACSKNNAFYDFNMSKKQELSEDSIRSSKIQKNDVIDGLITVLYINNILPKKYHGNEYFYVYMYIKNSNNKVHFTLNGKKSINVKELNSKNEFSKLIRFDATWTKYYLVEFKKEKNKLIFMAKDTKFSSNKLIFEKTWK